MPMEFVSLSAQNNWDWWFPCKWRVCAVHMTSNICRPIKNQLKNVQNQHKCSADSVFFKSLKSHLSHAHTFIICFGLVFSLLPCGCIWVRQECDNLFWARLVFHLKILVKNKPLEFWSRKNNMNNQIKVSFVGHIQLHKKKHISIDVQWDFKKLCNWIVRLQSNLIESQHLKHQTHVIAFSIQFISQVVKRIERFDLNSECEKPEHITLGRTNFIYSHLM